MARPPGQLMTNKDFEEVRERYVRLFGEEGVEHGECPAIETTLGISLPQDLKRIATFYSGGLLGGISHHALATRGPATNVAEETTRLRAAAALPKEFVVLAEPPDSLIVLNTTQPAEKGTPVIWCSAFDIPRLARTDSLTKPEIWPDYYSFFRHLLDEEEEQRREGES